MNSALQHRLLLGFLACAVYVITNMPALANDTRPGSVLCQIVLIVLLGGVGRGLATLGVITVGIAAIFGKVTWGMALTVGVGVSVIYGSYEIGTALGVIPDCASL